MNIILDVSFLKQCRESWLKKYIVVVATIIVGYKLVLTCVIYKKNYIICYYCSFINMVRVKVYI